MDFVKKHSVSLLTLVVSFGFFILFVLFSYLVHKNLFVHFDFDTTVRLQDKIPRRLDDFFSWFSIIGNFQFTLVILCIFLIIRRKLWGIVAFGMFGVFHLFELYGKYFVNHPPPPHFMLRTKHPIQFPEFYVSAENSYPSGHSGRALFVTIVIGMWVIRNKKFSISVKLVLLGVLIGYDMIMITSRVYLGEHWASDVIGGMLLGSALAFATSVVYK